MTQKSAIITGAGSGIGRATAIELAQLGFSLTLVGRRQPDLEETARFCAGADTLVLSADITDPVSCQRIVSAAVERFGGLDALIHSAGFAPLRAIDQITAEIWRQIIDTNLSAAVYLASAAWPTFRAQRSGVIVNLSSESARDPFLGLGAYGAAKAGVNLLGKALAAEGAPINLRVHTIAPGAVETQMLRNLVSPADLPSEKTLAPSDVARVITQCITGHLVHTSGEVIYIHK